jgi:hypothetical protein
MNNHAQHIKFCKETLGPDLVESGYKSTGEDLMKLANIASSYVYLANKYRAALKKILDNIKAEADAIEADPGCEDDFDLDKVADQFVYCAFTARKALERRKTSHG